MAVDKDVKEEHIWMQGSQLDWSFLSAGGKNMGSSPTL